MYKIQHEKKKGLHFGIILVFKKNVFVVHVGQVGN